MKSTPLCRVGVGENESGPNLISKAGEGAPRGQTRWEAGTDGDFQAGVRDEEGLCQVLEGQGRFWGQARSLQSPETRRDWSSGRVRASGEKRTEPPRRARARALLAARP